MMEKRLFDEAPLLQAMCLDIALHFLASGVGDVGRDLRVSHFYKNVEQGPVERQVIPVLSLPAAEQS